MAGCTVWPGVLYGRVYCMAGCVVWPGAKSLLPVLMSLDLIMFYCYIIYIMLYVDMLYASLNACLFHICRRTCLHKCLHIRLQKYLHMPIHTSLHKLLHACLYTCLHPCLHTKRTGEWGGDLWGWPVGRVRPILFKHMFHTYPTDVLFTSIEY